MIKQIAPADPLLAYPAQLRRLEAAQGGGVGLRDGHFVAEEQHALVMLATRSSPFDAADQAPLQAAIEAAFAEVDAQSGGRLVLEQSGVARFALAAETSMREDIGRISTVSLVGIVALFLLMFRSPRLVLLSPAPLVAGVAAALAACLALFGVGPRADSGVRGDADRGVHRLLGAPVQPPHARPAAAGRARARGRSGRACCSGR